MRMSKLVGRRIKEDPRDAQIISHKYIIRGGYARMVSAGIYSLLPLGSRICSKIETIIRDEMNSIEGQEVLMPVVLPRELWEESGRYKSVGEELLRFKDRNEKDMLLGMTHEEAVVHLIRSEVNSYKQLPIMVYQIQTKYRDEARPRAGLIRVREFTMKDAYSFHETQECLEAYYERAHKAYENIFRRIGMKNVVSIKSDSGMMGGKVSHEFMALSEAGEDTIFMSPCGNYKANKDIAVAAWKFTKETPKELEKVHTPSKETIEEVATFLGLKPENTGKAVFYIDCNENLIFAMIRGDFEVNETKLKNYLKSPSLRYANDDEIRRCGAVPGYASPLSLTNRSKLRIVVDRSVAESSNLVVGANEKDYHFKNFNLERDLTGTEITEIATVRAGDPCPLTGAPLEEKRGIEVGNIFQLGTKYSESMNCNYLDKNGKSHPMVMGCYGIGVGRSMASVIELSHDDYGPIWPMSIAPYQIHICALNIKEEAVKSTAEKLYANLQSKGIEVIFDDRGEKAGFMFNDADLIGVPFRVIISPKTLETNSVEFGIRGVKEKQMIPIEDLVTRFQSMISEELKKYQ
ncbi:MAG TPA: proline--tRNA ligase [Lentisphaeria bacterium]|nr:MAG: proline--tRNA ligase [Lentisphaerae bacterium GWF2_38_69]HBM17115.1 proline--tRNA ligase [Lentisphaeria bacterium]